MRVVSLRWVALALAVVMACVALVGVFAGSRADAAQSDNVGWFQWCEHVDTGYDDPIVYFKKPGASHRHVEFGNDFNAFTTRAKLMNQKGECFFSDGRRGGNHSAYWVQDLKLRDGTKAGGVFTTAYYTAWKGAQLGKMKAPPPGLKAVIRDVPGARLKWACGGRGAGIQNFTEYPKDCDPNSERPYVSANFVYPSCSDGRKNSPDHISHLRFPKADGHCPSSHPTPIPKLRMGVRYDTWKGQGAKMAGNHDTDPSKKAHADYFNAWNGPHFQELVNKCIKAQVKCWRDPAKFGF